MIAGERVPTACVGLTASAVLCPLLAWLVRSTVIHCYRSTSCVELIARLAYISSIKSPVNTTTGAAGVEL